MPIAEAESRQSRLWGYWILLGLYLTVRGYHSLDGDQAYRLPLLLHSQQPALFSHDPFVRAFDTFNPHRGSLGVLGGASTLLGLSGGLLAVFLVTFLATCGGIHRLARAVWPDQPVAAGWVALVLFFAAKAGNIGTNHLFEAMVLDRLMAMAAGWLAIAAAITEPRTGWWQAGLGLFLAAIIHPSLGLQLAVIVGGTWVAWTLWNGSSQVSWQLAVGGVLVAVLSVLPGLFLNINGSTVLQQGLSAEDFWTLAVELQSPQHMLPHLWRMPQWLAWGAYLVLAAPALMSCRKHSIPRSRLGIVLAVLLAWLAASWIAIEVFHHLRITVLQPFRMATVTRGLAIVLIAGRLVALWGRGTWIHRTRALLIGVALTGDWMLVVVTLAEVGASLVELAGTRARRMSFLAYCGIVAWGLVFLSRHDTESGHWPLLLTLGISLAVGRTAAPRRLLPRPGKGIVARPLLACGMAWAVPVLALAAGVFCPELPAARGLIARCRLVPVPIDDVERLSLWCRDHTPPDAVFVGPPGPKTFRLWSARSLAFNRAGSPYHAAGLADWFARFQDHVDLRVPPSEFVRQYVSGRHRLEARYDAMSGQELANLARRQAAGYVLATSRLAEADSALERLHTEGRYAVYRVLPAPESDALATAHRQE